jgi:hypothetical protein
MNTIEGSQFQFPFEQPARSPGRHVYALHFDPVRAKLYAAGTGGGIMWLNLNSGDTGQVHKIYGYGHLKGERLVSMAISPDGKLLVTGDMDGRMVLWNLELDCLAKKLKHATRITSLAFSAAMDRLLVAAESRELRLWTLPDYDFGLRDVRGEGGLEATFGPDGVIVERTGSAEQVVVRTRDAATGAELGQATLGHVELVMASQSPYLVALPVGDLRTIQVYDLPSLKLARTITADRDLLDIAALSGPSGLLAVAAGTHRRSRRLDGVDVWELSTGAHITRWRPDSENISKLAISADGAWLATADENGLLHAHPTAGLAIVEELAAEPATRKKLRAKKVKPEVAGWDWTPGLPPGIVLSQIQRHHADAMKRARATKNTRTVVPARKKEAEQTRKHRPRVTEPLNIPDLAQAPVVEPVVELVQAPVAPVVPVEVAVEPAAPVKRKPGRPRKNPLPEPVEAAPAPAAPATPAAELRGRAPTPLSLPPINSSPEPVLEPLGMVFATTGGVTSTATAQVAPVAPGGMVIRRRKVDASAPPPEPEVKKITVADLDALLEQEPSREVWVKIMEMLEGWPNSGDLMQDLVPRTQLALERWPDALRIAPTHMLSRLEVPTIAAIVSLSRALVWHKAAQNTFFSAVGHPALGNVSYVDLSHWQLSDTLLLRRALEAICGTRHLTHMRVLRLRNCNLDDLEPLTTAAPLDALQVLDISHNALSAEVMHQLGQITAMRSLKELDLSSCGLDTKNCKALAEWTNFTRLERLLLDDNQLSITGGMILGKAEGFTSLRYLSLRSNAIGHNGMSPIARGAIMNTLQTLDLTDNNLGADGLRALLRSRKVTSLHRLILAHNKLDDEAAQVLIDSGKRPHITHLDVSNNPISPAMLKALEV